MSGSDCCFLACIQVSHEGGKVIWYSHLFKNFPQFVVIHTVQGFSVVNEAEVDVFLKFSCFFYELVDVGNLISGSSAFSKSSCTSGSSWFTYCWSPARRILSITLLACKINTVVQWFEYSLALPFFGIGMKTDLFQSCGHCWVCQICWHIEYSTLTALSSKIWNSSTGIPSPPLALFIVMLTKAHLTSHSVMSGSRLVITPLWLSGSLSSFLYSSSVYSWHFLISSNSIRSLHFCPLLCHVCMNCSLVISDFLEEISSFPFYCFSMFLCIDHLTRLYLSLLFFGILHNLYQVDNSFLKLRYNSHIWNVPL